MSLTNPDATPESATLTPSLAARMAIRPIQWYQKVSESRTSPCRHVPSCSTYAIEAVETHGAIKGVTLATWRILRCNPWGSSGYDPVPERKAN